MASLLLFVQSSPPEIIMGKNFPPSKARSTWSPTESLSRIKDAETVEEVESEIKLLNQKRRISSLLKDTVTIRRIDNALQFGQEKLSIINQLNQLNQ